MTQTTRVNLTRRLTLAAALLCTTPLWAAPDAEYEKAFQLFAQARAGQTEAIETSATAFTTLQAADPANPVLLAYAGASTAMRANTTWLPWKKMAYAEDGMALLDKALTMLTAAHNVPLWHEVPAVLEVRFVAASTFLAVPGFMNRGARGAKLLQAVVDSPLLAASPLAFRSDVWMVAAKEASKNKRPDDARKYLNEVVKAKGPQQEAARAQLQALPS